MKTQTLADYEAQAQALHATAAASVKITKFDAQILNRHGIHETTHAVPYYGGTWDIQPDQVAEVLEAMPAIVARFRAGTPDEKLANRFNRMAGRITAQAEGVRR